VLRSVNVRANRAIGNDLGNALEQFDDQVAQANYQAEVASSALRLISTLFCTQGAAGQEKLKSAEFLVPSRLRGSLGRLSAFLAVRIARSGVRRLARKLRRKIFFNPGQPQSNLTGTYLGLEIIPFAKICSPRPLDKTGHRGALPEFATVLEAPDEPGPMA
jgi:hypothetical protein